jgi:hypothetical protein
LITGIEMDGLDPRAFFKYDCPTCRYVITLPPTEVIQMTTLFTGVLNAISRRFPLEATSQVEETDVNRMEYFTPLFMDV